MQPASVSGHTTLHCADDHNMSCSVYELRYFNIADNDAEEEE